MLKQFISIFGALTVLISGSVTAFIPKFAYVTIYTFTETPLEMPVPFARYAPMGFSFHGETLSLLLSSVGAVAVLLSFTAKSGRTFFLSSAGISLANVALLLAALPAVDRASMWVHDVQMSWAGTFVAVIGLLMMFAGFAAKNGLSQKWLISLPIMLPLYISAPILILSNGLGWLGGTGENALFVGVFSTVGHLLMLCSVFAAIYKKLQEPL